MKRFAFALGLMLAVAAQANAQSGPQCDLGQSRQLNSIANGEIVYIGGPVFRCDNGTTILADSAIYVRATGRIDFIRNVRFNEAERSLTSMYAQYVGRERRLMAQQNVVLTEKKNGSILRGVSLDYFQVSPTNREARIELPAGRPHATILRSRSDGAAAVDTTNIDADRMQIIGERKFTGWGNVQMTRGKLKTQSRFAEFDQAGSYMKLQGQAMVASDTFRLEADSIDADLENGDTFKSVRARQDAKLDSQDADVDAPRIFITFEAGKVERMIAVGGKRIGEQMPQAKTLSPGFSLIADSIDVITPGQKMNRVIAIGTARGERTPDSLDANLPAVIASDWVTGDTVKAYFGDGTTPEDAGQDSVVLAPSAADTARVLERIIASGQPAMSTYRLRETVNDTTELSVNYITARMIDVVLRMGEVDFVRAEGDIRGLYLQPPRRAVAGDGRPQQ